MFIVYLSIPLMVLALAVATVPLIIAMRIQEKERRGELAAATLAVPERQIDSDSLAA